MIKIDKNTKKTLLELYKNKGIGLEGISQNSLMVKMMRTSKSI